MPQVNRQVWNEIIHVPPFLVPGNQPIHGKGVPEACQRRATLASSRLNSGLAKQCPKGFVQHPVIQGTTTMTEKYAITEAAVGAALPFCQIALQRWNCSWMKGHYARLAKLCFPHDKIRWNSIHQQIRDFKTNRFPCTKACAGKQSENRLEGEWPQRPMRP